MNDFGILSWTVARLSSQCRAIAGQLRKLSLNFLVLFFNVNQISTAAPVSDYRLDEIDPQGKTSFYTARLPRLLNHWPPPTVTLPSKGPVLIRAIRTPSNENYIGMVKHFTVHAPLSHVIEVNEKFESYPKIWEGVLEVKVISRDLNRTVTEWTRERPAFFLPKVHYIMSYVSDKRTPDRAVYRQQLIGGNALNSSDSLVVFERMSETTTRVSVVNFFDANLGPFRFLAEGVIWKKSLEESFKDDICFISRLEHPDWPVEKLSEQAKQMLKKYPIDPVEYTNQLKFD